MSVFRIVFIIAFILNFAIVGTYRRKAQSGEQFSYEEEGKWVMIPLRLAGILGYGSMFVYMIYLPAMSWAEYAVPGWLRWASGGFVLIAMPILVNWAQRNLGRNVSTTVITRKEHELITTGPYRYVRHPLYTLGLVSVTAYSFLAANWFMLVMLAVGFIFILIRTPKEEAMLVERFGAAYRDYTQQTGRFFPKLFRA